MNALTINTHGLKVTVKDHGKQVTYIDRKTYGVQHNLKGAALTRAHFEYRRTMGVSMNGGISSDLAQGKVVAQRITPTASGYNVVFYDAAKVLPKSAKPVITEEAALAALGITPEQLAAMKAK